MGVIFYVACEDCKVIRCLDKFYTMYNDVNTRAEALLYGKEIEEDSFRAGLLVSFAGKHRGHTLRVLNDTDSYDGVLVPMLNTYIYEDFWR